MSNLQAFDTLSGKLSVQGMLFGTVSTEQKCLKGTLCVVKECESYDGKYNVIPKAFEQTTLNTANKLLHENVVISEVPYYETSNNADGVTVYIAKEVENDGI